MSVEAQAHPDPPGTHLVTTYIDLTDLTLYDDDTFIPQESDLNDGLPPYAELILVVEVQWGGNHGSSFYYWPGSGSTSDHQFLFTGWDDWTPVTSSGCKNSGYPCRHTSGILANIVTPHTECVPYQQPTIVARAFEVDKGSSWLASLAGAITGGAVGGTAGAAVGTILTQGLQGLNPNDELTVYQGSRPRRRPRGAHALAKFRITSHEEKNRPCKGVQTRTSYVPSELIPGRPTGLGELIPAGYAVLLADDSFYAQMEIAMQGAAAFDMTTEAALPIEGALLFGADEYHPFGRSVNHAAMRVGLLLAALAELESLTPENLDDDDMTPEELAETQAWGKKLIVGTAYVASAQAWAEAYAREGHEPLAEAAGAWMVEAMEWWEIGDCGQAVERYAQALYMLLEGLHPEFNEAYTEGDCNANGLLDAYEIHTGLANDCNGNGMLDTCEDVPTPDTDGDGILDGCDKCPEDPMKTDPGACGCGIADDVDGDGQADCVEHAADSQPEVSDPPENASPAPPESPQPADASAAESESADESANPPCGMCGVGCPQMLLLAGLGLVVMRFAPARRSLPGRRRQSP